MRPHSAQLVDETTLLLVGEGDETTLLLVAEGVDARELVENRCFDLSLPLKHVDYQQVSTGQGPLSVCGPLPPDGLTGTVVCNPGCLFIVRRARGCPVARL